MTARPVHCFPAVEQFLEAEALTCQKIHVRRTFLHINCEQRQAQPLAKKAKTQESADGEQQHQAQQRHMQPLPPPPVSAAKRQEMPAWEEYLDANCFRDSRQLVQTFLWRCSGDLVLACLPYPWRAEPARLAEILGKPVEQVKPCRLKEVQQITKFPLFICLPFGLPAELGPLRVLADHRLRGIPEGRELLFDCGTVALTMPEGEFWRAVRPTCGRLCS